MEVFTVKFAEKGSNLRPLQKQAFIISLMNVVVIYSCSTIYIKLTSLLYCYSCGLY